MNPILAMKTYANKLQETQFQGIPFALSHDESLEITVTLLSSSRSWQEFAARPHEPVLPATVERYCGAVTASARRLLELKVAPGLSRQHRARAAMGLLSFLTDHDPLRHIAAMLVQEGVPLSQGTFEPSIHMRDWLRQRSGQTGPWERTQQTALAMGFSPAEARLIRDVQHDAVDQSWHLKYWFEVGVLELDMHQFLRELQEQSDWFGSYHYLLESSGERISDFGKWGSDPWGPDDTD